MVAVVLAALVVPLALAVYGGWTLWRGARPVPSADAAPSEALRAAAERAAEAALPVPTLGTEVIEIRCAPGRFEAELQRVVRLADGVGGAASSWNDGQSVRILANVPAPNEDVFREAVKRGFYDIAVAGEAKPLTVVEVLLKPAKPD